jgi:Kef-type K+ transport system membrane component KefB
MTAAFIVQCFIILIVPYVIWRVGRFQRVLLCVIVQILVGVLLGPSLLGRVAPAAYDWLFQGNDFRGLSAIATLALLIFSFTTGLHVNFSQMRSSGQGFLGLGVASMVVPALSGAAAGYWLIQRYPDQIGSGAHPYVTALAIGCCCGVSALPVLGAILRELGLVRARLGQLALALAAFTDGALWLTITPLLALSRASGQTDATIQTLALSVAFIVAMVFLVGPALHWVVGRTRLAGEDSLVAALAVAIGSAALTEAGGLHFMLGAFLAGAVMPQSVRASLLQRLETPTLLLLMPFFFTLAGLRTKIEIFSDAFLPSFALLTLVAFCGKIVATMAYGKLVGEEWRHSLALGILLQSKGLTEVVVVTILLEAGLITPAAFSILIVMGLLCTIITAPLVRLLYEESAQGQLLEQVQPSPGERMPRDR